MRWQYEYEYEQYNEVCFINIVTILNMQQPSNIIDVYVTSTKTQIILSSGHIISDITLDARAIYKLVCIWYVTVDTRQQSVVCRL